VHIEFGGDGAERRDERAVDGLGVGQRFGADRVAEEGGVFGEDHERGAAPHRRAGEARDGLEVGGLVGSGSELGDADPETEVGGVVALDGRIEVAHASLAIALIARRSSIAA
jgi:hypothetical protein